MPFVRKPNTVLDPPGSDLDTDVESRASVVEMEQFIEKLKAPDAAARRSAARELMRYPDSAIELCLQLGVETNLAVREALTTSLSIIATQDVARGLLPLLRSEDAHLRNAAIEILQHMPAEVERYVASLLRDDDPDVRLFAVNILEALPHFSVARWLTKIIAIEEEPNVCVAAFEALGQVAGIDDVRTIRDCAGRFTEFDYVRYAADFAVAQITGRASSNDGGTHTLH